MERFEVSPIKINHLAFKLSNSGWLRQLLWFVCCYIRSKFSPNRLLKYFPDRVNELGFEAL